MAKQNKADREYKARDYVVYFIVAFVLIFLTSSFVIEDIYNDADHLSVNPSGVQAIYESSIGKIRFADQIDNQETDQTVEEAPETAK